MYVSIICVVWDVVGFNVKGVTGRCDDYLFVWLILCRCATCVLTYSRDGGGTVNGEGTLYGSGVNK